MTTQTEAMKLALEALEDFEDAIRYDNEQDDIGARVCCGVLSYNPHAKDCKAVKAITSLREALAEQPPVQQGWKLVPYDPSTDMQEQGSAASGYDLSQTRAKKVYQAMIDMHEVMLEREPTDEWLRLQAGYTEQPAKRKPTDEMVQAATDEYDEWANDNKGTTECVRAILVKALAAAPQPAPVQQVPLFKPLIDLHPGLAEELKAINAPAQQEPVALAQEVIGCFHAAEVEGLQEALAETTDERLKDLVERRLMHALYAAQNTNPPAQRKPLTRPQINQMMADAGWQNSAIRQADLDKVEKVARAIEAAHGIKEKNT